jgi:hypothetical protein
MLANGFVSYQTAQRAQPPTLLEQLMPMSNRLWYLSAWSALAQYSVNTQLTDTVRCSRSNTESDYCYY